MEIQFGERVGHGGWLIGPKYFRPEAYPACASSKALRVYCYFLLFLVIIVIIVIVIINHYYYYYYCHYSPQMNNFPSPIVVSPPAALLKW